MNVTLPPELEEWVRRKVASGAFASPAEAVQEAVRALREHELAAETKARLERYLLEGVDPGPPEGVTAKEWKRRKKQLDEHIERLVEEGVASLDRGEGIPADEVLARLRERGHEAKSGSKPE